MGSDGDHRKTCRRWNTSWQAHELTFSCLRKQRFLASDRVRHYILDAVELARRKHGFHLWAYVIMPEHVHLLIWPAKESYSISAISQTVKQSVSRKAIGYLRKTNPDGLRYFSTGVKDRPFEFWMEGGGYDRNVRPGSALSKMVAYIHNNPVRRGLVANPEDWAWSSSRHWLGLGGGLSVDMQSCIDNMTWISSD